MKRSVKRKLQGSAPRPAVSGYAGKLLRREAGIEVPAPRPHHVPTDTPETQTVDCTITKLVREHNYALLTTDQGKSVYLSLSLIRRSGLVSVISMRRRDQLTCEAVYDEAHAKLQATKVLSYQSY